MAERNGGASPLSGTPPLKTGMRDSPKRPGEIESLQRLLLKAGFNPGAIDGHFGHGTQAAVVAFQRSNRMLADGVVGPRTVAALTGSKQGQLASVIDEERI